MLFRVEPVIGAKGLAIGCFEKKVSFPSTSLLSQGRIQFDCLAVPKQPIRTHLSLSRIVFKMVSFAFLRPALIACHCYARALLH